MYRKIVTSFLQCLQWVQSRRHSRQAESLLQKFANPISFHLPCFPIRCMIEDRIRHIILVKCTSNPASSFFEQLFKMADFPWRSYVAHESNLQKPLTYCLDSSIGWKMAPNFGGQFVFQKEVEGNAKFISISVYSKSLCLFASENPLNIVVIHVIHQKSLPMQ